MSEDLLEIDISKTKREEDFIEIRFRNEEVVQVNFSKLFNQSKYIRDKYKYSEGIEFIQQEISDVEENMHISYESIKHFIKIIDEEKIKFGIEHYKNIYTLSEYFCTSAITTELDKINCEKLFKDLNFTIQILVDCEQEKNGYESKLLIKIENFLRTHINECLSNAKFKKLSNSTIFRILEQSKETIKQDLLVDFILESASTRFIMFKIVDVDKLSDDKVSELIGFFDKQEETVKKMYLEYVPFDLSFIKNIRNKYDQVLKEMNKLEELLNEMKIKCDQKDIELKEMKELNERGIKKEQVKESIKLRKSDNKRYTQSIIVGGYDNYNGLGEKPNNKAKDGILIISPPVKLSLDLSSLLSYSAYCYHSVLVMSDGSLKGIGNNLDGRISATLQKTVIKDFTDFCIKDGSGRQLAAVSAVCCSYGTLYMFSKSSGNERQLVLCDYSINGGDPVFLDIGNHHPVSLFGGWHHSAAIGSEGEVIFINRNSVQNSPKSPIAAVSLPDGEKASSVACCDNSVVVLSSNGRVFTSPVVSNGVLNFSIVSELSGEEIVCVSGTSTHCLAVSKEGRVFGRGSSGCGQLGLDKGGGTVSSFTEISSLFEYEIRAAYAGNDHSLFETREGKILSCGSNNYGELLIGSVTSEKVYSPRETTIASGATFCIAGYNMSEVFIGSGPPRNTPNTRIDDYE